MWWNQIYSDIFAANDLATSEPIILSPKTVIPLNIPDYPIYSCLLH